MVILKKERAYRVASHFVIVFTLTVLFSGVSRASELEIGLIPEQNIFNQKGRYTPLGEYIEKKTGIKITFKILSRYGDVIDLLASKKLSAAFLGSFTGAVAMQKLDIEPIARPVHIDGTSTYKGYIFVRKDSGITSVSSMKGKSLVLVERATTAGYAYPLAYLKEKGINNIDSYFRESYFAGSHDAAINAVIGKRADIGCAKDTIYKRMSRRNPRIERELAIIGQSPDFPSNALCLRKDLDPSIHKRIRDVLLGMHTDPDGRKILSDLEAVKFVPSTMEDYKPVFDVAKKAGLDINNINKRNK
ncbi:MAG: phosphate/phosphite/phosphonate ABC transporter substrate-binding protein [Thermodesulfovibrionales bacterium]